MSKGRVALSFLLAFGVSYAVKTYEVKSQTDLGKLASDLNKTLPMMVDKETEWLSAIGVQNVFIYNYRMVNHSVENIDPQKFNELIRPNIINAACTTPETKQQFLAKGVTLRYTYADKDRRHITSIDVTPADCKV